MKSSSVTSVTALAPRDEVVALAAHLTDPPVLVDAGCRWGFQAEWDELARRGARVIGFEADVVEAERLARCYAGVPSVEIVPVALGSAAGRHRLQHVEFDGAQSLHAPDRSWWRGLALEVGIEPVRTTACEMVELDAWCAAQGVDRVDALKLDVQGHELEILRGAEARLADVRLIECEVSLNPMFDGTPLFGEVDAWLRERGFVLWRLRDLVHYPIAGAEGASGSLEHAYFDSDKSSSYVVGPGVLNWANAHFVAQDWLTSPAAPAESAVRDALLANASRFHDLALLALRRAGVAGDGGPALARAIAVALRQPTPVGTERASPDPLHADSGVR